MPFTLTSQSYTFDPRPDFPLLITVKRYSLVLPCPPPRHLQHLVSTSPSARTFICAHGGGFCKEMLEPTLLGMYTALAHQDPAHGELVEIRDAWVIDCPNHGEAAILNEEDIALGYPEVFPWEDYGRAVHCVLANRGTGIPVDFSRCNLVGIGHSMGSVALLLSMSHFPRVRIRSLLLAEPMILPPVPSPLKKTLVTGALRRRDVWKGGMEEAREWIRKSNWDPQVKEKFLMHGLRPLPTIDYPDLREGVTLACSKRNEATTYRDRFGSVHAYHLLPHIASHIPVHVIYGALEDYITQAQKDHIIAQGAHLASVSKVPGAGHLLVLTHPREVGATLAHAMMHPVMVAASSNPVVPSPRWQGTVEMQAKL